MANPDADMNDSGYEYTQADLDAVLRQTEGAAEIHSGAPEEIQTDTANQVHHIVQRDPIYGEYQGAAEMNDGTEATGGAIDIADK